MENECLICAEIIEGEERIHAIGSCNHRGVCSLCFLRLRSIMQVSSCPICKTELESVVCTPLSDITFQEFSIWGENAGPGMKYDHKSRMFFPNEYYSTKVTSLWSCKCKLCDSWKRDIKTLSRHVSTDHDNQIMCNLCIENKKVFPSEQKIYTKSEYENHLRNGDENGFEGHPKCEFCKKRYYDKDLLFYHLQKDHFTCHLCDKMGIRYRYYNDYHSLESHFRKEHILCEEPDCLAKKFIVFADPIDHAAHMLDFHPNVQISRSIPIQFRTRREEFLGTEGESGGFGRQNRSNGFRVYLEGGMGGRDIGGEWQVELPDAARDPREVLREQQRQERSNKASDDESFGKTSGLEFNPNDYPALISEDNKDNNPLWTGKIKNQKGKAEDFPALSSSSTSSNNRGSVPLNGWGAPIQVNKKLNVVKNKANNNNNNNNNQSLHLKQAANGVKGATVVGFHPQTSTSNKSTNDKKVSSSTSVPSSQTSNIKKSSSNNNLYSNTEELTLAEKIRLEMTLKSNSPPPPVPPPPAQPAAVTTNNNNNNNLTNVQSKGSSKVSQNIPDIPQITPDDYPALPATQKEKKGSKNSSKSPSTITNTVPGATWGTVLSNYGVEVPKNGKTGSGIHLVKNKNKKNEQQVDIVQPDTNLGPPPGFILLDNTPPPGFFSIPNNSSTTSNQVDDNEKSSKSKLKSQSKSSNDEAKQNESKKQSFPGHWVSIGGSKGAQKSDNINVNVVSDSDYPSLGSNNNSSNNIVTSKNSVIVEHKKPKTKNQAKNELKSLAYKIG